MREPTFTVTGLQYKNFLNDDTVWVDAVYLDDVALMIDGIYYGEDDDLDETLILDTAIIVIESGDMFERGEGGNAVRTDSLETALGKWIASQPASNTDFSF